MTRSDIIPGSALVPSAGDGVSPSQTFPVDWSFALEQRMKESLLRPDAETNTRGACANPGQIALRI